MQNPFHHLARGVISKDGKVLLAHAIGHKNTFLPGGHIEFGESAKVALVREIKEELGLTCEVNRFLGLVEHKWEKHGTVHVEVNQVFEVTIPDTLSSMNPTSCESHLEFIWADNEELEKRELQPYPLRKLLQKFVEGDNTTWWESTLNTEIDEDNRN